MSKNNNKETKQCTLHGVSKRKLSEALAKYPKGTRFISPFSGKIYTVIGNHSMPNLPYHDDIDVTVEESSCSVYVRLDGEWADYVC
jgi:hypothetical protein